MSPRGIEYIRHGNVAMLLTAAGARLACSSCTAVEPLPASVVRADGSVTFDGLVESMRGVAAAHARCQVEH